MAVEIIATGRAVPPERVTNDDLAKRMDTTDEWIRSHTGIAARHIAAEGVATSDLALEAARAALEMAIERRVVTERSVEDLALTIDLIVLGTTTQDYYGCPSTACIVQDRLGARNAAAMDLSAACTGFIYGLETAAALLGFSPGRRRALVIGAETLNLIADWNDRASCVLFGDGAGAVLLERTAATAFGPNRRGLVRSILGADGSGAEHLIIRQGGGRNPVKDGDGPAIAPKIEMNGQAVYRFAVKTVTETIERLLRLDGISLDEVDLIVPHQANARIVQAAAKRLGVPEDKFYLNIAEYANTSAASIPIALDELNRAGRLRRGNLVLCVGFGGGLTWGGNLVVW